MWGAVCCVTPRTSHAPPCAQGLPNEQYRFVRRTIIGIVLATDMVDHSRLTKVDHSHPP